MIIRVSSKDLGVVIPPRTRSSPLVRDEDLFAKPIRFSTPNPWTPIHDGSVVDLETFRKWERGIPRHCKCQADYKSYKASTPPDFSSPEALWLWGFNLHNHVNRKLGKPELTIEDARKLWRSEDGEENTGEGVGGATLQ